jgi:GDP/UDP-N,N'-diacetylbacillosamine 2-epimerase (hydrolysing)
MRISLLTSSRADLGIQIPLLNALAGDPFFEVSVIAFGSHLDPRFGNTIKEVRAAFGGAIVELQPVLEEDGPADITLAMARTMEQFHAVWRDRNTDMIIALGDRYEMFAAVAAALPFGIPVTHLHGGETTKGAIDNALRHSITHMASLHFTGAEPYRKRVVELLGRDLHVFNTGALSLDNLRTMDLLTIQEIHSRFGIDLRQPTVLVTLHPETAGNADLQVQWHAFSTALESIAKRYRLLVTLPNADTGGIQLRELWKVFLARTPQSMGVDSLGALGYLSCMKHVDFMLGNSSSGYVEASFFPKHVIDVGERQTGRLVTSNIRRCSFIAERILEAVTAVASAPPPEREMPYGDGHAADRMVQLLKNMA